MLAGSVVYPFDQAKDVLKFYGQYSRAAPDELSVNMVFATLPAGELVAAFSVCYIGSVQEGESILDPLRKFGNPQACTIGPCQRSSTYSALPTASFPHGLQYYWKSGFVTEISAAAIDTLVERFPTVTSPKSLVAFQQYGGAIARIGGAETAFTHREAQYDFLIISIWSNPTESELHIGWARQMWEMMQPFTIGAFYVNNLLDEDASRGPSGLWPEFRTPSCA